LTAIEASIAPHISDNDRRDLTRPYIRLLGGQTKARKATPADLASIGVKHVEVVKQRV
jgi:hypothetical protein